jgi:hypothetical protein
MVQQTIKKRGNVSILEVSRGPLVERGEIFIIGKGWAKSHISRHW